MERQCRERGLPASKDDAEAIAGTGARTVAGWPPGPGLLQANGRQVCVNNHTERLCVKEEKRVSILVRRLDPSY